MLTDITTSDWFATMTVSHAEGTARIDYPALEARRRGSADLRRQRPGADRHHHLVVGREVKAEITGTTAS